MARENIIIFSLGDKWGFKLPPMNKTQWKNMLFVLSHKYGATYKAISKAYICAEGTDPEALRETLRTFFPRGRVTVDDTKRQRFHGAHAAVNVVKEPDPLVEFELLTGVRPLDLSMAKAAFRQAAVRLHPDRGGNPDQMARLNIAWAGLQRRFA